MQYYSANMGQYSEVRRLVDFRPMNLKCPCALLQTQLSGGPLGTFLMQNRNKPMQILGMLAGVIVLMVIITVVISTATYMRNKKCNRILPNRRVRRRPQKQQAWNIRNPFKKEENPADRFRVEETEAPQPENVNYNNNVSNVVRHWPPPPPPPPCAPLAPPLPPSCVPEGRQWMVPTVSAMVAIKPKKRAAVNTQDIVNKAMVSELKMRLEQKRMLQQY